MNRKQQLKELLEYYNVKYHGEGISEVSDFEYDSLKREYFSLGGTEEDLKYNLGIRGDVAHLHPVKSLSKVEDDGLRQELLRLAPGVIQDKYDGLTIVYYTNGVFATRGDGFTGKNVTHNMKYVVTIRNTVGAPIRGECYFLLSDFKKINESLEAQGKEPYSNARNAIAGLLNSDYDKSRNLLKYVKFTAYNIMGSSLKEQDQLKLLKEAGFNTPDHIFYYKKEDVDAVFNYVKGIDREKLDYEIDGQVIKSNIENALAYFGETSHHPKSSSAYKFPPEGKWTTGITIVDQVGRTGKITPVAVFKPIQLGGATVQRATFHNHSMLQLHGFSKGCEVFVIKAKDIIPEVIGTRHVDPYNRYKDITECPACHSTLTKVISRNNPGVYQLFCENINCPSRTVVRLAYLASKDCLDIEGLSKVTAQKMYDEGLISHPFDVFELVADDIETLEGFAGPSAKKLYNSIQSKRMVEFWRFIAAAGVPGIAEKTARDIADNLLTYEALMCDVKKGGYARLMEIAGIGDKTLDSIIDHYTLWEQLRKYVEPIPVTPKKVAERQLTFVITGTLSKDRSLIEQDIINAGHKATGSVSKKTSYVVVGENAGSKKDKAESLKIPIISEAELYSIIG